MIVFLETINFHVIQLRSKRSMYRVARGKPKPSGKLAQAGCYFFDKRQYVLISNHFTNKTTTFHLYVIFIAGQI